MSNVKKTPRRYGVWWICCNKEFTHDEFKSHLLDDHKVDVNEKTQGTKKMLMHLDGSDYFSSQYEWEIAGVKGIIQNTCSKRSKSSRMYWE